MNRTLHEKLAYEAGWTYDLAEDRLATEDEDMAGSLFMLWGRLNRLSRMAAAESGLSERLREKLEALEKRIDNAIHRRTVPPFVAGWVDDLREIRDLLP